MNEYDNPGFFQAYGQTLRSKHGLEATFEWEYFKDLLPDFKDKKVLDLGCGYGWHCLYAAANGASKVIGIDLSVKMLEVAESKKSSSVITYVNQNIAEVEFPEGSFDIVISSLSLHYLEDFDNIVSRVKKFLVKGGGEFIFSVENPIFTAYGTGVQICNDGGEPFQWPVDKYFSEGLRQTKFLDHDVVKYHRTMSTYLNTLIKHGFKITEIVEPNPGNKINSQQRLTVVLLISAKL